MSKTMRNGGMEECFFLPDNWQSAANLESEPLEKGEEVNNS